MPWENRFIPRVTRSTLPVRSPWPNRQPSTRSAPAIRASSVAAVAVPRSLCGCSETATCSRLRTCRENHSIWSAYTFGVAISTVAGRLRMISRPGAGLPDVHHRVADLDGELQLGPGEDLRRVLVAELDVAEVLLGVLHHQLGAPGGERDALGPVDVEHHPPKQRRGRVVHVDGRGLGPDERLGGALDQILASLGQHRDGDVVGDPVLARSAAGRSRSRSGWPTGSRPRSPCSPSPPAGRTSCACGLGSSGRSAPGCRPAGRWTASVGPW